MGSDRQRVGPQRAHPSDHVRGAARVLPRPDRPHDQLLSLPMKTNDTSGTVLGAIGGIATGYVLWLVAFSIAGDNATVGHWAPTVLILSGVLAICAVLWGSLQRRRGKYLW